MNIRKSLSFQVDIEPLASGLYMVATPIGNLKDISLRALSTLGSVDRVVCEDTRVTGKLLAHYGIKQKLFYYNDHSGEKDRNTILGYLDAGEAIALVSDAGTPLVSDPGYKLVRDAQLRGLAVTSIPGPCAAINALTLSGLPSDQFLFAGFLPPKSAARKAQLLALKAVGLPVIAYERASRLPGLMKDLCETMGQVEVRVVREMTKYYEEVISGTAGALQEKELAQLKGEIVVVIGAQEAASELSDEALDALLREHLQQHRLRDAVDAVAAEVGMPRKVIYKRALALQVAGATSRK